MSSEQLYPRFVRKNDIHPAISCGVWIKGNTGCKTIVLPYLTKKQKESGNYGARKT